jgi:hypothetical protein
LMLSTLARRRPSGSRHGVEICLSATPPLEERPGLIPTGRRHALRREWTDGAFPVLDPRGFYSTSGACSVSPFTTMVLGEGSARRQPEVASSAYSSSPRRNGHNLHRGGKSRFGSMMAVRIVCVGKPLKTQARCAPSSISRQPRRSA